MKALLALLILNLAFVQYTTATEDTNLEAESAMEFAEEDDKDLSLEAPQVLPNKVEEEIKTEELSFSSEEPVNANEKATPAADETSSAASTTESSENASADLSSQDTALESDANAAAESTSANPETTTAATSESGSEVTVGEVTGVLKYKITCTLNDDVREITSLKKADGSVSVVYKKFDSLRTIASAPAGSDQADQVADKIQSNLANNQYPYSCTKE